MVWTLAFSIQHEVEKYGAYLAVAAFLGLALLSILYFAQAREVRRLREWAGRAPERDAELEARVTSQAESARRAQAGPRPAPAAAAPARAAAPAAAAAAAPTVANGRAASPLSVPMGPRPATAAAAIAAATASAAPAAAPAAEGDDDAEAQAQPQGAVATDEVPAVVPVAPGGDDHDHDDDYEDTGEEDAVAPSGGNGSGAATSIPRATPRPAPRAQPLRSGAGARSAAVPPRRIAGRPAAPAPAAENEGSRRGLILGILAGIVVLAVAAVLILTLTGGSSPTKPAPNRTAPASTSTPGTAAATGPSTADTEVVILNGTTTDGLAAKAKTTLTGAGYTADKVPTSTDPNQATPTSTVFYVKGRRRQALAVGRALKISRISAIDPDTQTLADNSSNPPVKSDVVVVLGADQTP